MFNADMVARLVRRAADKDAGFPGEDLYYRLTMLEYGAGVRPGTWSRLGPRAADEVRGVFPLIAEEWLSRRDTKIRETALNKAKRVVGEERAEELVQETLGGLSLTNPGGALGYVVGPKGKNFKKYLGGARPGPTKDDLDHVRTWLARHTRQRALSDVESQGRKKRWLDDAGLTPLNVSPGAGEEGETREAPSNDDGMSLDAYAEMFNSPAGRGVKRWLGRVWNQHLSPSHWRVVEQWMQNPNQTRSQIARTLGVKPPYITQAFKKAIAVAQQQLDRTPRIRQQVDNYMEIHQRAASEGDKKLAQEWYAQERILVATINILKGLAAD